MQTTTPGRRARSTKLGFGVMAIALVLTGGGLLAAGSRLPGSATELAASTPARLGAAVLVPDLLRPGAEKVMVQEYNFGDAAVPLPDRKAATELRGVVHRPARATGRKLPLVIFLHGFQATCQNAATGSMRVQWPCPKGFAAVPSHRGYDYLANNLASHGFVVASISANGINGTDGKSPGAEPFEQYTPRAQLIGRHLRQWATWNTTGGAPFGRALVGAIDQRRVGLMGHSRGGGGIVRYMASKMQTPGFTVKAAIPLVPAFGNSDDLVLDAAVGVVLSTCDGDTTDAQGVYLIDKGRYAKRGDTGAKYTITLAGGNHNYYNTVWSPSSGRGPLGVDDAVFSPEGSVCRPGSPGRLDETQQRRAALAYINGFFRYHLGGEAALAPVWKGDVTASWAKNAVQVSRHPRDTPAERLVINRMESSKDRTRNALGGAVSIRGLSDIRFCTRETRVPPKGFGCLTNSRTTYVETQPHHAWGNLSMLKAGWTRPAGALVNTIPAQYQNISRYAGIQVRAALDFSDKRNPLHHNQTLQFTLTDAAGHRKSVTTGGSALTFPRLMTRKPPPGQHDLSPLFQLNQVRIPLSSFTGVDLTRIRTISVEFPGKSGSLGLSDLILTD